MNYNPYAAPQAGPPPMMGPLPGGPPQGGPQPWDVGEIISVAWECFKRCWGVLIGAMIVAGILTYVAAGIVAAPIIFLIPGALDAFGDPASNPGLRVGLQLVIEIIMFLPLSFFAVGMCRIWVSAIRGGSPAFGDLFGGGSRFGAMFASMLLVMLATTLGYVLIIVPGIILGLGLCLTSFFVADANMGPLEAMKASWAATNGSKLKLFLLGIVCFFIAMAGYVACCIGIFASVPVCYLALAGVYVRLSGRGTTFGGFNPNVGGGFAPPPGGGYGGPPQGGGYGGPPQGGGYGGPPGYGPLGGGGYGGGGPPGY